MIEKVKTYIKDNENNVLQTLKELVECNTFSPNKAGLDKGQEIIRKFMPEGYKLDIEKQSEVGNIYTYCYRGSDEAPIALHGHLDTLCPDNPSFNTITEKDGRIYGPGTHDMKGGITVLIWALNALAHIGMLQKMSLTVIFSTDEEIGAIYSRQHFYDLARENTRLGIKFECGEMENTVVTTRKGMSKFQLTATGVSQHAGNLKSKKLNAISELAHKVLFIESLGKDGINSNVGVIKGGIATNVVAEHAYIKFEVRAWEKEKLDDCIIKIEDFCKKSSIEGIKLDLRQLTYIQPWQPCERSKEIFKIICDKAQEMNQTIVEEKRAGISDSNLVASVGIPAIDGLGPIGTGDCTTDEFIVKQSIFDRIELVSRLLSASNCL